MTPNKKMRARIKVGQECSRDQWPELGFVTPVVMKAQKTQAQGHSGSL